ncbi:MAG TPA: histidine--tRNA ligase [Spirochaetes bacterium]|nr:histidine--tRNA ligase [Spirochaetota bacterium]
MPPTPPGIVDIYPDKIHRWNRVVETARESFRLNNYREIIIPILEYTEVFARGLGDETDIVSKEMFTFEDRGGRSLTLRPEGTASVVRAYVANGDYHRLSTAKFCYFGPMFRAEKPQKGRLRQFNQFGAELFGSGHPYYDYEVIAMMDHIAGGLDIGKYRLLLNSIGCPECRAGYLEELKNYYRAHEARLCEDCRRRLERNTFRLLDCKQESCAALKEGAPVITGYLCAGCAAHFDSVKGYLSRGGVDYEEDPFLVRGLDYYTRTTFEFVTDRLGGQNAFAAGGRYDNLVELFGGKPTPGVGFAAGIERLLLLMEDSDISAGGVDAYVVHSGEAALPLAVDLLGLLKKAGISAEMEPESRGFKAQFKKAHREKARFALIIGEDEAGDGSCTVKNMLSGEQRRMSIQKCVEFLASMPRQ